MGVLQNLAKEIDKSKFREEAIAARNSLKPEEKEAMDESIRLKLSELEEYKDADTVLCYASYHSEVSTFSIMKMAIEDGKALYCPRVVGKNMVFLRIYAVEELQPGYNGIMEPLFSDAYTPSVGGKKSLFIMPGVAYDRTKNRIGYGGGFYDRFLGIHEEFLHTVALGYSCQVYDEIPSKSYDIKPHYIVTDKEVIS